MPGLLRFLMVVGVMLSASGVQASIKALPDPREFGVADGLPSSRVTAITEDQFGYLWFATGDGLARYDGSRFRIWRMEQGLRTNHLWSLHVDQSNRLWIGTQGAGFAVFSADRRRLRYYDTSTHAELQSNIIWAINSTADGAIWLGTENGLYRLAPDGSLRSFFPQEGNERSLPSRFIVQLAVSPDGELWVGTQDGVARWTGADFERLDMSLLGEARLNSLVFDASGRLWIGTDKGLLLRHPDRRIERPHVASNVEGPIQQMLLQDRHGEYWFEAFKGIGHSADGHWLEEVPLYSDLLRNIDAHSISFIYQDRDEGIWIAAMNNGLWYLPGDWRQFAQLKSNRDDPDSSHNQRIFGMGLSSRGGAWGVGDAGHLDYFNPATGLFEHHVRSERGTTWMLSVAEDSKGNVWIGRTRQLQRYRPSDGELVTWNSDHPSAPAPKGAIKWMVTCDADSVWLSSGEGGLQRRDLEGNVLWSQLANPDLPGGIDVLTMRCGPDGVPWLGTAGGLMHWSEAQQQFVPVPGAADTAVNVLALVPSAESQVQELWVGRQGELTHYRWQDGALLAKDRIDQSHGVPLMELRGLLVDGQGLLWMTTLRGLLRIDPETRAMRLYGLKDGLRSQEFLGPMLTLPSSNHMMAPSTYGLVILNHAELERSPRRPPLVLETVTARLDDDLLDLTNQTPLVISPQMRDLQFTLRHLSFTSAHTSVYRFKLDGYDPDWVEVGASGQRLFSELPAGAYRLQMQARTVDDEWSDVQEVAFRVQAPWWASAPGIALYVVLGLLGVGLGVWGYRRRLRAINTLALEQTQRELAESASLEKTRFLANFGHEVRTPLTGVMGMSELLLSAPLQERELGYVRSIQQAGEHLLRLVNDALDLARIEAGKIDLRYEPVLLQQVLDDVLTWLRPLARNKALELRLDARFDPSVLIIADAMRLRQILLNLVGNAIKFTAMGSVTVVMDVVSGGQGIWFEVCDTGPGMSEEQQQRVFLRFEQADGGKTHARYGGTGLGLAICRELAVAMGGDITLRSRLGQGACFRVALPLTWETTEAQASDEAVVALPQTALRILLVEDDPTVSNVICGLLQAQGHTVVPVVHGLAALGEVVSGDFDIALLDWDLPGMDGVSLARQIRAMGKTLPLLAVTARANADAVEQASAAGFQGFLRKPVTGALLAEAIVSTRLKHAQGMAVHQKTAEDVAVV